MQQGCFGLLRGALAGQGRAALERMAPAESLPVPCCGRIDKILFLRRSTIVIRRGAAPHRPPAPLPSRPDLPASAQMLSLVGSPLSLAGASAPGVAMRAGTPAMAVERSASIPFLKKPPALDGSMVGDVGFDPLGISTTIIELGGDLRYVRAAPS